MLIGVRWCTKCDIPLLTDTCEICGSQYPKPFAKDLVPVFAEEMTILRDLLGASELPGKSSNLYLWNSRTNYYYKGRKVASIKYQNDKSPIVGMTKDKILRELSETITDLKSFKKKLYNANKSYLDRIENEAIQFIRDTVLEVKHNIALAAVQTL